jgi:hypothetical protein
MVNTLVALAYFALSVANDALNVQWHQAREEGQPVSGANISVVMGAIAWVPYVLFVTQGNWQIVAADLAGNWVGSWWGIKKASRGTVPLETPKLGDDALSPGNRVVC